MPELPEVETVMQAVAKAVGYSNIIGVTVNNNRFAKNPRRPGSKSFRNQNHKL